MHGFGPERFYMPEINGAGLALFDMDGDGDLDLYVLQGADLDPDETGSSPVDARNRLYANRGDGTFEDVTERAGVGHEGFSCGCAVGDYDGDGRLDLYVTNVGPNVLYRNLGDGRFEDVTAAAGAAGNAWGTSAAFVDLDGDGDLDLYVVQYIGWQPRSERACRSSLGERTYCSPNSYSTPTSDLFLRNLGDGTFVDASREIGLHAAVGNGFGLVWGEIDERPGIDVYVANDGMPNQLWSMGEDGRLEDRAPLLGCALSGDGVAEAGMGVCLEDVDMDGVWDIFLTHLQGETNTLYRGERRGFRDATSKTGTMAASRPFTGFGVGMADFDHDGRLDLFVANGRVIHRADPADPARPLAEVDQVFRGRDGGAFELLPDSAFGPKRPLSIGRGAAFGDIDGDGDIDVCVNDCGGPLRIYRNVAPKAGGAAILSIVETDGLPAVGAVVRYRLGERAIQRQVQTTSSFCSSNDPRVHVGLGKASGLDEVEVTWLDGAVEAFGPVAAGASARLRRGEGRTRD